MTARRPSLPFVLITVFLDVLGVGLILPVLPAIVGTLAPSHASQSWWYGAIVSTYGIMQFLCSPLLGALSDRVGRRPVLLLSIFGLSVSYFITPLATSLWLLVLLRVLSGATGASFAVANAYVADITTPENRSKGFGLLGAAFGIGFIFGPVVGGLLGAKDLRFPYFLASGLAMLNWLYGFFVLPESLPLEKRTPLTWDRANPVRAVLRLRGLRGVGGLVGVFAMTLLAELVLQVGWVLYTSFRFGWGPERNGIALFMVGISAGLIQGLLLPRLIKMFGERRLLLIGVGSAALAYVGFGLATTPWVMYALILANSLSFVAGPVMQSLISRAAGAGEQGATQGALQALSSVMTVAAPLIATPLLALTAQLPASDWRLGTLFFACSFLQTGAFIVTIIHLRKQPPVAAA